jgi:tetratricopeptide (TPR) repeat protein
MSTPSRSLGGPCSLVSVAALALVWLLGQAGVCEAQVTARTLVGRAVSDGDQDAEINNAIGRFRDRDIDGCRALLERARTANPKLPPPGVMMAMLWLGVNQVGPARAELESTAVAFPGDPEPYLMLGDLAFQERRLTEAAVLFERAAQLTAAFTDNLKRKRDFQIRSAAGNAAVAEARRQWDPAKKLLATWLELEPDNASAHQRMGIVEFRLGDRDAALARLREARKLDEKAAHPELAMARLLDDAKESDAARRLVEAALAASPKDASVQFAAAQWYLGRNELEAATRAADMALEIDADSLEARLVRGAVARAARDYATAETFFNAAHVQSPGNFGASNSLALVLVESADEASRRRALEMAEVNAAMHRDGSPNQVGALTTLAWVFYKLGRREDAEKILEQISRNNALTSDGALYVATILADRGERDRARTILEEVLAGESMFATRAEAVDLLARLKQPAAGQAAPPPQAAPAKQATPPTR